MRKEKPLLPWKVGGWIITRKTLILKGGWVGTLHKNHVGNRVVWQKKIESSVNSPSPSLEDDISLLTLYPSFLEIFMNICHKHGIKWRYEFNHTKSGVITFGETKPFHSKSMKEREWMLGDAIENELY